MSVHIILPMAGMGRRFKEAGYKTPKPFIHVACRPMFVQVLNNMPERHHGHLHVVTLADPNDDDLEQREMHLRDAGGDLGLTIIRLRELTGGAACTVLEGISGLEEDPVTPVIVANCDQYLDWEPDHFLQYAQKEDADGAIATFRASGVKWSFADVKEDGTIAAVAEKIPISHDATCGVYYFRNALILKNAILQMMAKQIKTNGEFYLAPCYNEMIAEGMKIVNYPVPRMYGMGTPEDLEETIKQHERKGIFK